MNAAITGTSVPEQIASIVFDALQLLDPTINCEFGRRATEDNAAPHSVVAVPLGAPTIDDHGLKPGGSPWGSNGGRQLMIRHFRMEWQCHDGPDTPGLVPDFTNAEALALNTMIALRLALDSNGVPFHNGVQFSDEEWTDQQNGADSYERSGHLITFVSTLDIPVYDSPPALLQLAGVTAIQTTVTELDQTVTIDQGDA